MNGRTQVVAVSSDPPGAQLFVDDEPVGVTPTFVDLPRRARNPALRLEKEGFRAVDVPVRRSPSGWLWGDAAFVVTLGLLAGQAIGGTAEWAHMFVHSAALWFGIDLLTGAAFSLPRHIQATLERTPAGPGGAAAAGVPPPTREGLLPPPPVERVLPRGFVDVNAVSQASISPHVPHVLHHPPSDPTQRYHVRYKIPDGPAFDISGGMRIKPNLSIGLAVSRFGRAGRTAVDSVDFPARRGTVINLGNRQLGLHLQTGWVVEVADRFDAAFFAGPSLFSVLQTRVTDVQVSEAKPSPWSGYIEKPMVTGLSTRFVKRRLAGFNYGFDFTFRITERVGIGILVRSAGSIGGHTEVPVAGGSHVGIGARFRFGARGRRPS